MMSRAMERINAWNDSRNSSRASSSAKRSTATLIVPTVV